MTTNNEVSVETAVEVSVPAKAPKVTLKLTVATVKESLASDLDYLERCICLLASRQTEDELVSRETRYKNKRGFASSKAVWGTRYAEAIAAGQKLSELGEEHVARAVGICTFHAKQIARAELEAAQG